MKAFQGCTSLTSLSIPSTVTSIGDNAFLDCSALTNITVASGNTSYNDGTNSNGSNCIIETSSNKLIVGANNTTIPDGVEIIGYMAFYGRTGLTTITLPYSIRNDKEGGIDPTAFRNCSNLTSVYAEIRAVFIPTISTSSNPFEGISSSCKLYIPYSSNNSIWQTFIGCGWNGTIFKGGIEIIPRKVEHLAVANIDDQQYTGSAITPAVTVRGEGSDVSALTSGTDYTVSYSNNTNVGTATVTITGQGNYTGTREVNFTITARDASTLTISSIAAQTYSGSAKTPTVTVKNGNTPLTSGTDYTVSYSNNINAGTATVTITGKGNYTGTKTADFTINPKNASSLTISSIAAQTYTGSALTPTVTVKDGTTTLTRETDYTVSYSNNTNKGTATVTITGKGNYTGTKTATFTINRKNASGLTISDIAAQTYSGSALTPAVTVKDGTTTLTSGTDYTVSYSNNTNAGTATVTITGKGNYTGTKTANFTINPKNASNLTISSIAAQTYNGSAHTPDVTVKDGTTTLADGTDYTVAYSNNINAGTATVAVTGKGNYTGTKTANFTISARSASNFTISDIAEQTYNGSALTPAVTVTDGDTPLTSGTDYYVTYSNNTNVGTATVTVTGKGNYTGTKTANFTIIAPDPNVYDEEAFAYITEFTYVKDLADAQRGYNGDENNCSFINCTQRANHEGTIKANVFCVENFYGTGGKTYCHMFYYGGLPNKNGNSSKGQFNFCMDWYGIGGSETSKFSFQDAYANMEIGQTATITGGYTVTILDKVTSENEAQRKLIFSVDHPLYFGGGTDGYGGINNFRNWVQIKYLPELDMALTDGVSFDNTENQSATTLTYTREFNNTNWQALYVPFALAYDDWSSDFEIASLKELVKDGNEVTLVVEKLGEGSKTTANTPYVIKAKTTGTKTLTPTSKVLFKAESNSKSLTADGITLTFTGTYTGVSGSEMYSNSYFAMSGGTLYKPKSESVSLGSYRWYMAATGLDNGVKIKTLVADDETGIIQPTSQNRDEEVYDLSGRRVARENAKNGIYIINGKKVLVK